MKNSLLSLFVSFVTLVSFSACGSDDNPVVPVAQKAQIAVLHASPDAPKVNVSLDGDIVLSGVDYQEGSGYLPLEAGSYKVNVDGILPGNTTTNVISADLSLSPSMRYVVIAANSVSSIEPIVLTAPIKTIDQSKVRVQIAHASSLAPEVDVYVTAPNAELNTSTPLGSAAYKDTLGPVEVAAGSYQIRLTPKDSKTVVYDSGSVDLTGGSDLVVAAIANVGVGSSPVELAVMDGTSVSIIKDTMTPAALRVIHNSPDAPAVDIVVNDNFTTPLVSNLAYPNFTGYVEVPADTYNVKVAATGTQTTVIDANLTFTPGMTSSVYAVNKLENIEPLILQDDNRSVATEAKVRIVHGSPTAPNVDIYVTAVDENISTASPAFTNVPFKGDTGYVSLAAGTYQVRVTVAGTKTVAIDTGALSLSAGGVYTAIARDAQTGETGFGLILLDDFNQI